MVYKQKNMIIHPFIPLYLGYNGHDNVNNK